MTVSLAACTPKPASAKPVVEEFLEELSNQQFQQAAALSDDPGAAETLEQSWKGLQAEGIEAELVDVDLNDSIATAKVRYHWDLPRDRDFVYESDMTLNRINDHWSIRWQPAALHPKLGANQHLELRAVNAEKASVVSSDGADVLVPGTVYRVLIEPDQLSDAGTIARSLVAQLQAAHGFDETVQVPDLKELEKTIKDATSTYSVTTLSKETGERLKDSLEALPGVRMNPEAAMVNTDPNFAPDVVARVTSLISDDLEGQNGWKVAAVTSDGAELEQLEYHAPDPAPSVEISLDHYVQRAAEEAVNLRADKKAVLVAVRPSTGQILAIAQTDKADEDGDIALTGMYPPGSTFKIITASAGIEDQDLNPGSIVPCPGSMNIYGRVVNNYNGFSLGNVPLQQAFARSCNTTFADISTKLHPGQLEDVGKEFGIGVDYDIPGIATVTGDIPHGDTELSRTEAGYGQGEVLVSPFGLAMVSATAAAGHTPVPTLISSRETKVEGDSRSPEPKTVEQLRDLMAAVTAGGGTAAGMSQQGGKIFAKTGEAEINNGSHAWFTGYREDDIAFATLVVLGGGSETAVAVTDKFFNTLDELRSGGSLPPEPQPQP
ncbi:Beta-lactam-inducible penicillin-binding protein [Corynebacterium pseudopelargi]|uniref:Beta-lactam-inducible penicillin-binding protein n=2 Tax=Corynebacterium pseudopelargi TaxID=2080757 RepID=A0A3G6ITS8_9CORY|nr:Beta-lactam-inducible penicillin-binding protein [Corynebacterium pseudopelargi]